MKEKTFILTFVVGLLLTGAVGVFSLFMELNIPTGSTRAAEEYNDLQLLGNFTRALRDFRRAGLNYLILRQEGYLEHFNRAEAELNDSIEAIQAAQPSLGDPALVESVLEDTTLYIQRYRQAVEQSLQINARAVLGEIGQLIDSGRLDAILDDVSELDNQNYLDYARYSEGITGAARRALLAITLFEVTALGLVAFSGVMLLRAYGRNKMLLDRAESLRLQLEEANRELESFIRIVGHDLRAPLVNIKGFSEEIRLNHQDLRGVTDSLEMPPEKAEQLRVILQEQVPEAIEFITASADTLSRLIKTMVTAARAGQLPVNPVEIDAGELLKEILKDFDYRIKEARATVRLDPLPGCIGDRDQLRQVFSNLVDNAIKYRDTERPLEIRITGRMRGHQSVYTVEDNGIGIAAEDLGQIFDLYHQIRKKEMTGEGIGLATVRKLAERNGGSVEVWSQAGRGSRFIVSLPRR